MNEHIRPATPGDVSAMIELAERKRLQYELFQPVFWRKAADSRQKQIPYFEHLLGKETCVALVHEQNGQIDGFIIGTILPAPPVYDPGGLTCLVDDFALADEKAWESLGAALLAAVRQKVATRGVVQTVVVCAHLDEPKQSMLRDVGLSVASEWYVG